MEPRSFSRALAAGAAGAAALTLANEVGRRTLDDAPRLDLLGERAVSRLRSPRGLGRLAPWRRRSHRRAALAGNLAAGAIFYALAATGRSPRPVRRGLWFGLLAGVGAVTLAPRLGLGHRPSDATVQTAGLTLAWYALGGVVAGMVARRLARNVSYRVLTRRTAPPYSPAFA
jgi:hypothetical protein